MEIAKLFRTDGKAITHWVARGCPYIQRGKPGVPWLFDPTAVIKWREEYVREQARGNNDANDIDEAKLRKLAAEAAMAELELGKRRGELVEMEEMLDILGTQLANVRQKLLSMPTKAAPQAIAIKDAVEMETLLEEFVVEALEELSADGFGNEEDIDEENSGSQSGESQAAA